MNETAPGEMGPAVGRGALRGAPTGTVVLTTLVAAMTVRQAERALESFDDGDGRGHLLVVIPTHDAEPRRASALLLA